MQTTAGVAACAEIVMSATVAVLTAATNPRTSFMARERIHRGLKSLSKRLIWGRDGGRAGVDDRAVGQGAVKILDGYTETET